MVSLSIVIPNYKGYDLLEKCIASIRASSKEDYEIIVVDNGSMDVLEKLEELNGTEKIKVIFLNENAGFSKAVNIGIKEAKGELIAVLNNDTKVDNYWVENVLDAFDKHKDVFFITSKILQLNDRKLIDDVGDVLLLHGKTSKIGYNEIDAGQYDEKRFVFGASGAACVYRKEFFNNVGYFDEDFFSYLEDVDLSFRANLYGLKCLYVPDAVVYHIGSASTGSTYNDFTLFYLARNLVSVIVKNYPCKVFFMASPRIIVYLIAIQAYYILKGFGLNYTKGLISGIGMIKRMLVKRREIMSRKVLTDIELIKMFKENKMLYERSKTNRVKK